MINFIGDFSCKVDPKGRIMIPQAFKKQMTEGNIDKFIIKKDLYANCLLLIPIDVWNDEYDRLWNKLDEHDEDHRMFFRAYSKGIAEVELDTSGRFLVPARLLKQTEIDKDVVITGKKNQLEIWSQDMYDQIDSISDNFKKQAKSIFNSLKNNPSKP